VYGETDIMLKNKEVDVTISCSPLALFYKLSFTQLY